MGYTEDVDRGEGRLQLVSCYSARDKIGGLDLGEQREGVEGERRFSSSLPGLLAGVACGVA